MNILIVSAQAGRQSSDVTNFVTVDISKHPPKTEDKGSLGGVCQGGRLFPVPWQEVCDAAGRISWKASEDIGEPGSGIDAIRPTGLRV
jgi:hypothetical protein